MDSETFGKEALASNTNMAQTIPRSTMTITTTSTTWDPEFVTKAVQVPPGTYTTHPGQFPVPLTLVPGTPGAACTPGCTEYDASGWCQEWGTCSGARSKTEQEGCMTLVLVLLCIFVGAWAVRRRMPL